MNRDRTHQTAGGITAPAAYEFRSGRPFPLITAGSVAARRPCLRAGLFPAFCQPMPCKQLADQFGEALPRESYEVVAGTGYMERSVGLFFAPMIRNSLGSDYDALSVSGQPRWQNNGWQFDLGGLQQYRRRIRIVRYPALTTRINGLPPQP